MSHSYSILQHSWLDPSAEDVTFTLDERLAWRECPCMPLPGQELVSMALRSPGFIGDGNKRHQAHSSYCR